MPLSVSGGLCAHSGALDATLRKTKDVEKRRGFNDPLAATKRAAERRYALNIGNDGRASFTCKTGQRGRVLLV